MRLKASGKNAERILIHRFTSVLISMMTNQGNGSAADASYNDEKNSRVPGTKWSIEHREAVLVQGCVRSYPRSNKGKWGLDQTN
jgi:hypothetical protein